ncbi:hypothetical protein GF337_13035 [candidate division KSB1 bacterium]|nr:hypothetical protein [candidate division KSB1 bacterium]
MKYSKFLVVLLVLIFVAGNAFGQMRQPQKELFGGVAFPMAPDFFKDYYKMGYSIHGQYVMFPSPSMGVVFGVAYEPFSVDKDKILEDFTGYTQDELEEMGVDADFEAGLSILEIGAGIRPYLSAPESTTQLFLLGMATYNIMRSTAEGTVEATEYDPWSGQYYTYSEEIDESDTENKFGLAVGAGIEVPAGDTMNLIFQGLYRFIFIEDETASFVGITAGLVF